MVHSSQVKFIDRTRANLHKTVFNILSFLLLSVIVIMPVPSAMERQIKIQRDSSSALTPHIITTPTSPLNTSQQQQQQQQETRTWRQETYSTKRVVQGSTEPVSITKSQDLFSNKHNHNQSNNEDRRGSSTSTTSNNKTTTNLKSSSLVSKALQELEDDFNNVQDVRRNSKTTTTTTTTALNSSLLPASTPTMEIVPSGSGAASPNSWSMGTDAQGDVPLTYEIVTKSDGVKEFQLLLTARDFSPEDLQVKLVDNTLTISGNHEERSPNGAYKQKSFSRTCTIPSGVRPEDLNCSLDSCGRLKITAPVPDLEPITSSQKMIKTSTHHLNNQNNQLVNWNDNINLNNQDVMTSMFDNNGMAQQQQQQHSTKTVTKTVKTFKTVA